MFFCLNGVYLNFILISISTTPGLAAHFDLSSFSSLPFFDCSFYTQECFWIRFHIFLNLHTVLLDLSFIYARVHKATARNIHGNAPE